MKTIEKNKIIDILCYLAENNELIAPVKGDNHIINFSHINNVNEVTLDFYNSNDAPKKLFFPQSEDLFAYTEDGKILPPDLDFKKQRVIFGLRPCDTESIKLLDIIFDGEDYKDPYYVSKRKNTVIFSLACNRPQNSCFCTSFDIGPFHKNSSDVLVIDSEDKYIFDPASEKGKELIDKIPGLIDATKEEEFNIQKLAEKAESRIKEKFNLDGLSDRLEELFNDDIWDEIHQPCMGCGICTFSCPTCHCFDIIDEQTDKNGKRVRIWDSCMNPSFTLEASGHTPRPSGRERMRQRIMHKFNYFYKNYGKFSCVGCGRCLRSCPGGLNIKKVIKRCS
ncbi:MAG TPA: 4Fe-4S dicluster domain-containing protein [Victivallales bacterium]|nr:4Fe-4S dicluster domain-containing protein [Victivallales bacterium]